MRLGIGKGVATALTLTVLAAACGDEEEVRPQPAPSASAMPPADPPDNPADPTDNPIDPPGDPGELSDAPNQTILELIAADTDLSVFQQLVERLTAQGLVDTLNGRGPFTVFTPTNAAFENLPFDPSELTDDELRTILSYHVIPGAKLTSSMLEDSAFEDSLEGRTLNFDVAGDAIVVNGLTTVTDADIDASNGVVHGVDTLLIPPGLEFRGTLVDAMAYYPSLSKLVDLLAGADEAGAELSQTLAGGDDYTLFAPTHSGLDDGVSSIVTDADLSNEFLRYHVVPPSVFRSFTPNDVIAASAKDSRRQATFPTLGNGTDDGPRVVIRARDEGVQVNDSNVIFRDLVTTNGTIHVIDQALTLPEDIVTIARANPELSRFVELVEQQNLVALLQSPGEQAHNFGFTVFAPAKEAFEALEALKPLPEGEMLTQLLLYHIVRGQVDSVDVAGTAGAAFATLNFDSEDLFSNAIDIDLEDGVLVLNGSTRLVATDIPASNGIIHIIDSVLTPEDAR